LLLLAVPKPRRGGLEKTPNLISATKQTGEHTTTK